MLGVANKLVKCDPKFDEVVAYLLGRVIVVDTIDNAIALAKKNHCSLHIVTVEGEYLAPGALCPVVRLKFIKSACEKS